MAKGENTSEITKKREVPLPFIRFPAIANGWIPYLLFFPRLTEQAEDFF